MTTAPDLQIKVTGGQISGWVLRIRVEQVVGNDNSHIEEQHVDTGRVGIKVVVGSLEKLVKDVVGIGQILIDVGGGGDGARIVATGLSL